MPLQPPLGVALLLVILRPRRVVSLLLPLLVRVIGAVVAVPGAVSVITTVPTCHSGKVPHKEQLRDAVSGVGKDGFEYGLFELDVVLE